MEPGRNNYPFRDWRDDMEDGSFNGNRRGTGSGAGIGTLLLYAVELLAWLLSMGLAATVIFPIIIGSVAVSIQGFLYLKNGAWPFSSIIDLMSHKKLNIEWAHNPETMLGLHKILAATDLWMLLPVGLVWVLILILIARIVAIIARHSS